MLRERWVAAVPSYEIRHLIIENAEVFLKGQQGIFKPRGWSKPLSITSTLDSPYTDDPIQGSQVLYDFAPRSREYDNAGLKRCAEEEIPLIYFLQVKRKPSPEYVVFAPIYIVGWDEDTRQFLIDLSEQPKLEVPLPHFDRQLDLSDLVTPGTRMDIGDLSKSYLATTVLRRLHQARFRNQVLKVYRDRCAVCVLRVRPLLDAAHIIPDRDPKPSIPVNEGMSLCAIHHRAFDARILRYNQNFEISIELPDKSPIGEAEKSMLLAFDGRPLTLPKESRFWPASLVE